MQTYGARRIEDTATVFHMADDKCMEEHFCALDCDSATDYAELTMLIKAVKRLMCAANASQLSEDLLACSCSRCWVIDAIEMTGPESIRGLGTRRRFALSDLLM